jgi:hypothetical protein
MLECWFHSVQVLFQQPVGLRDGAPSHYRSCPKSRSYTSAVASALAALLDEREQIEASQVTFLTRH